MPAGPSAEFDDSGHIAFRVGGIVLGPDGAVDAEISLDELWRPLPERRWERDEYTYDLIDRGRNRRRAFHLHDRSLAQARLRSHVHEHCEEVAGEPACGHYLGREIPDGYVALDLLVAAWLEPRALGCPDLICLDRRSLAGALRDDVRPVSSDESWDAIREIAEATPDPDRMPVYTFDQQFRRLGVVAKAP